jgi:hypothetical protein
MLHEEKIFLTPRLFESEWLSGRFVLIDIISFILVCNRPDDGGSKYFRNVSQF